MAEVIKIIPRTQQVSGGVIEALENMLGLARKGEINGVAIAAVDAQGFTHSAYDQGENIGLLIGACERVKYRLLKHQAGD